ncbi:MAG: CoA transferase [Acidimicrobiaceae bacterium]|nr:CoA transferase [Acidimicrobiaceae bacterium]
MSDLLRGVRVLESAVLLNGDTLGMLLGDLGADVIKVEAPPAGDYLRDILGQIEPRHSPAHLQANKNKRSIGLDLGSAGGREVLWDLLEVADVFVDGFTAGAADRLGIGYEQQRSRKPDIVYCQYTGFGSVGPYARMPTHGQMMNAGAAAVTLATADDGFVRPAENRELMWGTSIGGDGTAAGAVHAALRVAAALYRRQVTGEGCFLDVSAADAVVAQGWIGAVYGLNYDRITDHTGLKDPGAEPLTGAKYQYYRTSDERFVLFCCIEPKFWERFCRLVGRDDLIDTQLEPGPVDFARDADELRRELQAVFETRTQREWVDMAVRERVPIGPAHQGAASLRDDPQIAARQILVEGHHPSVGPFTYVGEPAIVDKQPYAVRRPAPAFGAHTTEILTEIGYDEPRIADLFTGGVVAGD